MCNLIKLPEQKSQRFINRSVHCSEAAKDLVGVCNKDLVGVCNKDLVGVCNKDLVGVSDKMEVLNVEEAQKVLRSLFIPPHFFRFSDIYTAGVRTMKCFKQVICSLDS